MPLLPIWNPQCEPSEHAGYESEPDDALFLKKFEDRVAKTIHDFQLIPHNAKVLVAVSGGKDSLATLYMLKKLGYPVEAVTIDVHIGCYTKKNLENVKKFCAQHNVKLHAFEFREAYGYSVCYIQSILKQAGHSFTSCTVCGVLRRRLLNKIARDMKADVIATGHNRDDEVQAILMNWLKNKQALNARLGPMSSMVDDESFIPRIKPLYTTSEADVIRYTQMLDFPVHYGRCPCSVDGLRHQIRQFLSALEELYPRAQENIMNFFLKQLPLLKERHKSERLIHQCSTCGEPSSTAVCRSCQILVLLQEVTKGADFTNTELAPVSGPELAE